MPRLVVESTQSRNIVGQLERGDELIAALLEICDEHDVRCATFRCSGWLEDVVLVHRDPGQIGAPRQLHGPLQVVSATGTLSEREGKREIDLDLIGLRKQDGQLELVGGSCSRGSVVVCEIVLSALEDIMLRRGDDPETGFSVWVDALSAVGVSSAPAVTEPEQPAEEGVERAALPPKPGKMSWSAAVAASSRRDEGSAADAEPELDSLHQVEVGDVIDHQKFGRCLVQRVDPDQEYATVRLRNGRLVRLNLEVLDVSFAGQEEGHQVFRATPPGG